MRSTDEQCIALECLKLAHNEIGCPLSVVDRAKAYFAFVTGTDIDDAKEKLAIVRKAVS